MPTQSQTSSPANARTLLLPYLLGLIVAMAVVQIVIAATGGEITILAGILTAVVALGIAVWLWRNLRVLKRVRFGVVIAHVIAFVTVTASFNLHAILRLMAAGGTDTPASQILHDAFGGGWFGVTIVMSAVWGLGLLVHLVGAVLGRGWED
jgi:glucan phosphoethanolaminetransferase (alkaline phosphatase superfamily)